MAKYRVWYGDGPDYKKMSSLAEAIKYFRKHGDLEEDESGIEEFIDGEWDEWLDEDDQNVHEHLYMYGGKSAYLRSDEDEEDDFDEDEEDVDEEDVDEDEDDSDEVDMEDRLMNVIGGNTRPASTDDEEVSDEESFDDTDDEDDFDEDEEDDEDED